MKKVLSVVLATMLLTVTFMMTGCSSSSVKLLTSQIFALTEVQAYKSDMAIIDSTMAGYMLGQSAYSNLSIITLEDAPDSDEYYGVAAKSGNLQLIDEVNKRLAEAYADGTMLKVAETYSLEDRLTPITYTSNGATDTSFDDILNGDKILTIAYTNNPPMGISGSTSADDVTGFDIDLAKAIFPELTIETKEIPWTMKVTELNSNLVDLVWNGLTIDEERKTTMAISEPYLINEQAFVVLTENKDLYSSIYDLVDEDGNMISIAVEDGSAGEDYALAIEELVA